MNSQDLVDKIKNMNLNSEDRLVSFEVETLFPCIPVDKLMKYLEKWFNYIDFQKEKVKGYVKLTRICAEQSYFTFFIYQ